MPALDIIHNAVKNALIKAGWTITDDPLVVTFMDAAVFVDLGAERVIAAERGEEKIAIEIKTFGGRSSLRELEVAFGQYEVYRRFLKNVDPKRKLFIAISERVYNTVFRQAAVQWLVEDAQLPLIVVDVIGEEVVTWIN